MENELLTKALTHNAHALLSSSRKVFSKFFSAKLSNIDKVDSIISFNKFVTKNLSSIIETKQGQFLLYECSIISAIEDKITIFDMSVDFRTVYKLFNNSIDDYIKEFKKLIKRYSNKIILHIDLGINRRRYTYKDNKTLKKLIDSGVFNGIDIFGDELSTSIRKFKKIYKYAKRKNLVLKAHVGEFGTAKDIKKAIKILKLDMVQHGISIVNDKKSISYARKKHIIFNVCPTSNLILSRIDNINNHPIRKMYDCGLIVTINTDDQLILQSSLFNEYKLLYKYNIFSIKELNEIMDNGLKAYKKNQ